MMNILLGWMRALTDGIWRLVESPGPNGLLSGFGAGWLVLALALIGAGIVVDWIIWMIRWQPYHVWATRLRAFRRLLGRNVEAAQPAGHGYHTVQYMPATQAYGEAYEEAYDGEAYEAEEVWDEQAHDEPYEEAAYEEDDGGYDPYATYRRPALQFPSPPLPTIPDSQLGDYPGKRYDPSRMPQVSPQDAMLDPLAPYDAYDEAPAPPPPPPAGRRRRSRAGRVLEEPVEEPIEEFIEEPQTVPNNIVRLYGEPEYAEELEYNPDFEEDSMDADDLPDAPQWPQWQTPDAKPKGSLFARARKLGEAKNDPYGVKKRGMLAQMLDPQVDSIKGLPPRVDRQSAFQQPTYPQPYEPQGDPSPWDEEP